MDIIGKSPIFTPALVVGKVALFASALFVLVKLLDLAPMLYDSLPTSIAGAVLYAAGIALLVAAIVQLGQSIAVGLPDRQTELMTDGLYRFTRNPIYLGAFMICAGSCLYAIHPVNFLLFALALAVHLRIVRKEEEFLAGRFGQAWLEYRRAVPRFLGLPRRIH